MPDPSSMTPDPNPSYGALSSADQASSDPATSLTGLISSGVASNVAQSGLSVDQLMGQIGLVGPETQQQNAYSGLQGQYAEANSFIGQEQLGLEGQGLADQSKLEGIQYAGQQQALAGQRAQANVAYGNQQQQAQSQQATSGAANTKGQAQAQNTAQSGFAYQQQQFQNEQTQQGAQHDYSVSDIARGQAGIALASQQNGLSLDQTLNQINYGMTQAGQQGQMTEDQLYGQVGQAQAQGATYTAGAIAQAGLLGNAPVHTAMGGS